MRCVHNMLCFVYMIFLLCFFVLVAEGSMVAYACALACALLGVGDTILVYKKWCGSRLTPRVLVCVSLIAMIFLAFYVELSDMFSPYSDELDRSRAHSIKSNCHARSFRRSVRPAAPSRRIPSAPSPAAANVSPASASALEAHPPAATSRMERARAASDKNQVMDALLGGDAIPADYGERMAALFRDGSQDVLTRDFAVQHLGLYAQALARRGEYDAASADARALRAALDDAAGETRTIVAAAAFRALADVAEFDPNVDASRLDARLAACVADDSASVAARVMAAQLCGERGVSSVRPALERLAADADAPVPLRRAASHSLGILGGKESGR